MKRSMSVSLLMMGTAALPGCGEKNNSAKIYKDADTCIADGAFTAEKCRTDFAAAVAEHDQSAPSYDTVAACEKDYGANSCQPTSSTYSHGSGHFIPLMIGYLAGNIAQNSALSGSRSLYQPLGTNDFRTGSGISLANIPSPATVASRTDKDNKQQTSYYSSGGGSAGRLGSSWGSSSSSYSHETTTVERGGFGFRGFRISA